MKKTLIAVLLGIAGALALAAPAAALPSTPPPAAFHTVLWEITTDSPDVFLTPQAYIATFEGDDVNHWVGDGSLKCATRYQADAYDPSVVAGLIADGLLHGGEDAGLAHHWNVFTTPDCVKPDDESTPGSSEVVDCAAKQWVITNWHDVVTYSGDPKTGYTADPVVRVADPDTYRDADTTDCPPPPPPAEEQCGTDTTLACTPGGENLWWQVPTGSGILLLGALLAFRRRLGKLADRVWFRFN